LWISLSLSLYNEAPSSSNPIKGQINTSELIAERMVAPPAAKTQCGHSLTKLRIERAEEGEMETEREVEYT